MRLLAALTLLAFSPGHLDAAPRIVAGEPACASCDRPGVPHVEPFLAAHPADPNLLFGAAVTFPESGGSRAIEATTVAGFRSLDGGKSWLRRPFPRCLVDPWVSFGKGFGLYFSCLERGGAIAVYRSADGGATWGRLSPVPAGGGGSADHPILAVDRSAGARGGAVYVIFAQVRPAAAPRAGLRFGTAVAASSDGGRSFSAPVLLRDGGLNQQPFDAVVLDDGALVVLFMDYASRRLPLAQRQAWAARSEDGGRSFSVAALPVAPPDRLGSLPLAADPRSPPAGGRARLYLAGAGGAGGGADGQHELAVASSADGGKSWERAGVAAAGPPPAGRETPALAVNDAGVVGLAWYDTRRDPRGECFDVYFSASTDGGRTFLAAVRLTPEVSCPRAGSDSPIAWRWPFGGDYSGLAALADGRFRLFWSDSRTGIYQVWTAVAEVAPAQ
jgi:hypothetical protein